jgi:hypothetical protein
LAKKLRFTLMKTFSLSLLFLLIGNVSSQYISSSSKYYVHPQDTIRIQGSGFNTDAGKVFIRLGLTFIKPIQTSYTQITFLAPENLYTGQVFYLDTASGKTAISNFDIRISTLFEGAQAMHASAFRNTIKIPLRMKHFQSFKTRLVDFNNDGQNDLMTTGYDYSHDIYYHKNGLFDGHYKLKSGFNPEFLYNVNDFNQDGRLDIIMYSNDTLHFLSNTSNSDTLSFREVFSRQFIDDLSFPNAQGDLVDFNGDGRHDFNYNISYFLNDPVFFLNKKDSAGNIQLDTAYMDSGMIRLNNIRPVNLNNDSLTDLIAMGYSYPPAIYFLVNTSKGDSLHFMIVDSINDKRLNFIRLADFNKDHINDVFVSLSNYASGKVSSHLYLNEGTGKTFKLKEVKNDLDFSLYPEPVFWDYNFDSIPDIFYTDRDTSFCKTLFFRNDSLHCLTDILFIDDNKTLQDIMDINNDRQPDLVFDDEYKSFMHFYLGNAFAYDTYNARFSFLANTSGQIFYDSMEFVNRSSKTMDIQSLDAFSGISLFSSGNYKQALGFPLKIPRDSLVHFYFSYTYSSDRMDSIKINNNPEHPLAIIKAQYKIPNAIIRSISKTLARPGDTIDIRGQHLFRNISDISVRINNRRCDILGNSTDTSLKIIYPAMTSAARILITDTFKHYNTYTKALIYPTYTVDTSVRLNQYSFNPNNGYNFRSFQNQIKPVAQKYLELPGNLTTGHYTAPPCLQDTSNRLYVGKIEFKPYYYLNDHQPLHCNYKFYIDEQNFFPIQNQQDLNADGLLDMIDYYDSIGVYFCTGITDSSITYSDKKAFKIAPNHLGIHNFNMLFFDHHDFDLDGISEYMAFRTTYSPLDSIYFFNYNSTTGLFDLKDYFILPEGEQMHDIGDFTNDGKPDIVTLSYNNAYSYKIIENISSRGNIRLSPALLSLIDSTQSINLVHNHLNLNNDEYTDLITNDNAGNYWIYLADTANGRTLTLTDYFYDKNRTYYRFNDIDGDGYPEFITQRTVSKYSFDGNKIKLSRIMSMDSTNYNYYLCEVMDADGDLKPDLNFGNVPVYNTMASAKFKNYEPMVMETDDYRKKKKDSFWVYNNGSSNIHLQSIVHRDTSFTFSASGVDTVPYPVLIKARDSARFYITFNPRINLKKFYRDIFELHFKEDVTVAYKQVWAYVNQAPVIKKVLPERMIAGDTAAIIGKNFDNLRSRPMVNFADSRAEIIAYDDTLILVKVPYGNFPGVITVYDTMADLLCFSPKPIHYTFTGTSGAINKNSFRKVFTHKSFNSQVVDANLDGYPDIYYDTVNYGSFEQKILLNHSSKDTLKYEWESGFRSHYYQNYPLGYYHMIKDFDADGYLDFLLFKGSGNFDRWDLLINGRNYEYIYNDQKIFANGFAISDLNHNGKLDISFGNHLKETGIFDYNLKSPDVFDDCNYYKQTNNELTYTKKASGQPLNSYDFDGDGLEEVIYDYNDSSYVVAFNKSNKDSFHFTGHTYLSIANRQFFHVADINLDGKLDVVTICRNNNDFTLTWCVFKNTSTKGNLSFTRYTDTIPGKPNIDYIGLQDFNGDGRPELYGYGNFLRDSVMILTNNSSKSTPFFDKWCKIRVAGQITKVSDADMNADSKSDLIVQSDSGIFVLYNTNIAGYLSRQSYTFNEQYGFPLSLSLALYSTGGDTLIIDKIIIPDNYELVNNGGNFNFNGLGNDTVSLPLKIASADSFPFSVAMKKNLKPGKYSDTVLFYNNQGAEPYRFIIKGEVKRGPIAYISKTLSDLGKIKISKKVKDSFYIKNIGLDVLSIGNIRGDDTVHYKITYNTLRKNIAIGDSLWFNMAFTASAKGKYVSEFVISHNDFSKESKIEFTAEALAPIIKDSVSIRFRDVAIYKSKSETAILYNTGNDTLRITGITSTLPGFMTYSSNRNTGDFIIPGDSLLIIVTGYPDTLASFSGNITITHNTGNKQSMIRIRGNSVGARLSQVSTSLDLGKLKAGKTYNFSFKIDNTGSRKLKIRSLKNTHSSFQHYFCQNQPDSVDAGKSGYLCLTLKHNDPGVVKDSLIILSNGVDSLAQWTFSAEFIRPVVSATISKTQYKANIYRKDTALITLTNSGSDTLFNIAHISSDIKHFSIIDPVAYKKQLLPGKSESFLIEFVPDDTSLLNADINFSFGNDTGILRFKVSGRGYGGIASLMKNTSLTARISHSANKRIPLINTGNRELLLASVMNRHAAFNVSTTKIRIAPFDTSWIDIRFQPTMYKKTTQDTLIIQSVSDSILYSDTLFINGKTLYPEILFSKTGNIVFPGTKTKTSRADSVFISNTGDDTLKTDISKLTNFVHLRGTGYIELAPGKGMYTVFEFTPQMQKQYSDSLRIWSNTETPYNAREISGTGIFNRDNYQFTLTAQAIDFGDVMVNFSKKDSIQLNNTGSDTLTLFFETANTPFLSGTTVMTLYPGQKKYAGFTFNPLLANPYSTIIRIKNEYHDSLSAISLSGNGKKTSIQQLGQNDQIQVYPNPANEILEIRFEQGQFSDTEFILYDLSGKIIPVEFKRTGNVVQIYSKTLANGMYLLSITSGQTTYQIKVIIHH